MADNNAAIADLLPAITDPLGQAGIDPNDALRDIPGAMAKLNGTADAPEPAWFEEAQNIAPPRPGTPTGRFSQNGNPLPSGLHTPQNPTDMPDAALAPASPPAAPAVPASVTPTGDPTTPKPVPSWADLQRTNVTKGMNSLDTGDAALEAMRQQPDLATQTATLEAQRARDAAPLDPSNYKPTFGQKLLRGVTAAARGGFTTPLALAGVINPKLVGQPGYNDPTRQYTIDTSRRAAEVSSDDQQLTKAAADWKALSDRQKALATDTRSQADSRKGIATEINGQENAENNSPEGKAGTETAEFAARGTQADSMGLKGPQRTMFITNGRLPDPKQPTAEDNAMWQATQAWHRDNPGKQPGVADVNDIQQSARGLLGGRTNPNADSDAQSIVADATGKKQEFANSTTRNSDGTYTDDKGNPMTAQQFTDKINQFALDANKQLAPKGYKIDDNGTMVSTKPASKSSAPIPQPPGADVKVPGPDRKLHWGNSKTRQIYGLAE